MLYFGVDPGQSGAIACIDSLRPSENPLSFKLSETERDVWVFLNRCRVLGERTDRELEMHAYIERVHSMPKQGVASSFKFGQSYGFLRGLLIACHIPFEEVSPVKWQTAMGCRSAGDKNVTKAMAQQLFPNVKVTHANADALLIAEYCRRTRTITPSGEGA
jgi:Holliday junction resolvasome RuvABC endonuclease subunit